MRSSMGSSVSMSPRRPFNTSAAAAAASPSPDSATPTPQDDPESEESERKRLAATKQAARLAQTQRRDFQLLQVGHLVDPYRGPPAPLGWGWMLSKEGRRKARARAWVSQGFEGAGLK